MVNLSRRELPVARVSRSACSRRLRSALPMAAAFLLVLSIGVPVAGAPPLAADELMLLCNKNSEASRKLADTYAELRQVPAQQRLELDLPTAEWISRDVYDDAAAAVRKVLQEAPWGERIRCIAVFYDVPLKVGPRKAGDNDAALRVRVEDLLKQALQRLRDAVSTLETQAGLHGSPLADASLEEVARRYLAARTARAGQVEKLDGDDREIANRSLLDYVLRCEGRTAMVPLILANASDPASGRAEAEALARQAMQVRLDIESARGRIEAIDDYQQAMQASLEWFGLLNTAVMLGEDVYRFETDQTHASFDSELSLVRGGRTTFTAGRTTRSASAARACRRSRRR